MKFFSHIENCEKYNRTKTTGREGYRETYENMDGWSIGWHESHDNNKLGEECKSGINLQKKLKPTKGCRVIGNLKFDFYIAVKHFFLILFMFLNQWKLDNLTKSKSELFQIVTVLAMNSGIL